MTTDADPKPRDPAARIEALEERASRLTGAVWFMLDAQLALIDRIGALAGDPAEFRRSMAAGLDKINRQSEPQLSPRARTTYIDLLARLRDGATPTTPYVSPEVERSKVP